MKIKCPACDAVLEIDSSMSGQVVDCECGKKLRVPNVNRADGGSRPVAGSDSLAGSDSAAGLGAVGVAGSAIERSPEAAQSFTSSTGTSVGVGAPEQNPFRSSSDEMNPYAASNNPYDAANQPVPIQTGGDQGLAIASLVLGICSLTLVCCGGFLIGIPAVICGVIAIKKANRGESTGKGMAIAGVTTGGISLGLFVAYLVLAILGELLG